MARSKTRIFSQFQSMTAGTFPSTCIKSGESLSVNIGPDRAANIPKAVSGITDVAKSLAVKSHSVLARFDKPKGLSIRYFHSKSGFQVQNWNTKTV